MSTGSAPAEGTLLWTPPAEAAAASRMAAFMRRLEQGRGLRFADQEALWRWSVTDLDAFWREASDFLGVRWRAPARAVLARRAMPGAEWFPGGELSYAEHALAFTGERPALVATREDGSRAVLSRDGLREAVARAAAGLAAHGVGRGDTVVAVLPNGIEAAVAFLAAASLGATWSSCSPEFGVPSVLDRFRQVAPKSLVAVVSSRHAGRVHDKRPALAAILAGLPTLAALVVVEHADDAGPFEAGAGAGAVAVRSWTDLVRAPGRLAFESVPFDHPLWVLYSSGTTGLPKPIVQGHGGILLEHLKTHALHLDLAESDRFFWYTTTGWMMWNFLLSGLLVGSTVVLHDGSPSHPDLLALWRLAAAEGVTFFGASAPFLMACRKAGVAPGEALDLSALRAVGSTGSPLPPEGFAWVGEAVGRGVQVASVSGGTDVCTAFCLSSPLLPVRAGEITCRGLGAKVEAFDEGGRSVVGEVGELVLTEPLPSMPLRFVGDADGSRMREAYFTPWEGVWRHGDWLKITERGGCVITGRSDATLNRAGVRMGTSEFYRVVEALPAVADSLVVDAGGPGREDRLWLFVVLKGGRALDAATEAEIRGTIRSDLSPRHVPDRIVAVPSIPRTISGKKLEVPVKRILLGALPERAASRDALADPASLDAFVAIARRQESLG